MSEENENPINDRYQFDFGRVAALLHIIQGVATTMPQMVHITAEATAELRQINTELGEIQRERAEVERQAAEEERQRQAEELRLQAEAEDNPAEPTDPRVMPPSNVPGQPVERGPRVPTVPAESVGTSPSEERKNDGEQQPNARRG